MQPKHEYEKIILNNDAIRAMSKLYYASYFFDLPDNTFCELHSDVLKVHSTIGEQGNLRHTMRIMSEQLVRPEYKAMIAEFTDIDTLDERMKDKEFISCEYEGIVSGWSEAFFVVVDRLDDGKLHHVLFLIRTVSEKRQKEFEQLRQLKEDLEYERLIVESIQEILGSSLWSFCVNEDNEVLESTYNDAFKAMIGIEFDKNPTIEEIFELIHAEDKDRTYQALLATISDPTGDTIFDQEYRIKTADGAYRWFRGIGKACKREGIPGITFFGVLVDVNEKILAQQAFEREQLRTKKQLEILFSAANIYLSMHLIDFDADELIDFSVVNKGQDTVHVKNAQQLIRDKINNTVNPDYKERMLDFIDFESVCERLRSKTIITEEFVSLQYGWIRVSFIIVSRDENDYPKQVLFTSQVIEEEKRREEELLLKSNTDKLTRFLNRTAYEEDLSSYAFVLPEDDFVFVSLDLNGLKYVNDTYGHVAGDEAIVGATTCMKEIFANYGKLYRIGGDEFVAMIRADSEVLPRIMDNFERAYNTWSGHYVDSIAISYGYASRKEFPDASVEELAKKADARMYEAKADYYRTKGVDRRGQLDAYNAICNSYIHIAKVDLTNDRYQDIHVSEALSDFSSIFSVMIQEIIRANIVADEDVEYFQKHMNTDSLRQFFKRGNREFCIRYRRRIKDEYRLVMTEIIATPEYTDENQQVFIYVKDIDFL